MFYPLPTEIPMRLYEPREEYRYLRLVSLIMDTPENIETSLVFGQRLDQFRYAWELKKRFFFFHSRAISFKEKAEIEYRKKLAVANLCK